MEIAWHFSHWWHREAHCLAIPEEMGIQWHKYGRDKQPEVQTSVHLYAICVVQLKGLSHMGSRGGIPDVLSPTDLSAQAQFGKGGDQWVKELLILLDLIEDGWSSFQFWDFWTQAKTVVKSRWSGVWRHCSARSNSHRITVQHTSWLAFNSFKCSLASSPTEGTKVVF